MFRQLKKNLFLSRICCLLTLPSFFPNSALYGFSYQKVSPPSPYSIDLAFRAHIIAIDELLSAIAQNKVSRLRTDKDTLLRVTKKVIHCSQIGSKNESEEEQLALLQDIEDLTCSLHSLFSSPLAHLKIAPSETFIFCGFSDRIMKGAQKLGEFIGKHRKKIITGVVIVVVIGAAYVLEGTISELITPAPAPEEEPPTSPNEPTCISSSSSIQYNEESPSSSEYAEIQQIINELTDSVNSFRESEALPTEIDESTDLPTATFFIAESTASDEPPPRPAEIVGVEQFINQMANTTYSAAEHIETITKNVVVGLNVLGNQILYQEDLTPSEIASLYQTISEKVHSFYILPQDSDLVHQKINQWTWTDYPLENRVEDLQYMGAKIAHDAVDTAKDLGTLTLPLISALDAAASYQYEELLYDPNPTTFTERLEITLLQSDQNLDDLTTTSHKLIDECFSTDQAQYHTDEARQENPQLISTTDAFLLATAIKSSKLANARSIGQAVQDASIIEKETALVQKTAHYEQVRKNANLHIHDGKQGKHIIGHNSFEAQESKSILTHSNPSELVEKHAGTGFAAHNSTPGVAPGTAGYKECVDCGEIIGLAIDPDTKKQIPTSWIKIIYANNDVHIVPTLKPKAAQ